MMNCLLITDYNWDNMAIISKRLSYLPENIKINLLFSKQRKNIKHGMSVAIVLKQDQESGYLTDGIVRDILTKSPSHPHGIKVRLMSGEVGRVKEIY